MTATARRQLSTPAAAMQPTPDEVYAWAKGELLRLKWQAVAGEAAQFAEAVVAAVAPTDKGLADLLHTAFTAYGQISVSTTEAVVAEAEATADLTAQQHRERLEIADDEAHARGAVLMTFCKARGVIEEADERRQAEDGIKAAMAQIHEIKGLMDDVLSSVELVPPGTSLQSQERLGDELSKSEQARARLVAELQVAHEALNIQASYLSSGVAITGPPPSHAHLPPPTPALPAGSLAVLPTASREPSRTPLSRPSAPPPRPPPPPPHSPPSASTTAAASPHGAVAVPPPPPPLYEPWQAGESIWTAAHAPAHPVTEPPAVSTPAQPEAIWDASPSA